MNRHILIFLYHPQWK